MRLGHSDKLFQKAEVLLVDVGEQCMGEPLEHIQKLIEVPDPLTELLRLFQLGLHLLAVPTQRLQTLSDRCDLSLLSFTDQCRDQDPYVLLGYKIVFSLTFILDLVDQLPLKQVAQVHIGIPATDIQLLHNGIGVDRGGPGVEEGVYLCHGPVDPPGRRHLPPEVDETVDCLVIWIRTLCHQSLALLAADEGAAEVSVVLLLPPEAELPVLLAELPALLSEEPLPPDLSL